MKASMNWLSEFIDLSDVPAETAAKRLTLAGVEVGEVEVLGDPNIVVGRIDAIEDHPKADRLVMCRVDVGDGRQRNIACGAKNMKAGDIVPVALPGAKPPGLDFEILERKVVGTVSEGMLCAEEELGLADHSDGLWILPDDLKVGTPIFQAIGLQDAVLDIDLTPNRPDCLSQYGIAVELGALLEKTVNAPELPEYTTAGALSEVASLSVDDPGCPRYAMAVMEDIEVGPSPAWLRNRLAAVGTRSINNVVDVTNYVLMHVGQPLHAFDLDKLEGGIIVRRAKDGESMTGIDHKEYRLDGRDLVIADSKGPVAIAGVMGGERTEVTEETKSIVIECAYFDPTTVRKSAKRLGLHTESSHRFERGIDPNAVGRNLALAIGFMLRAHDDAAGVPTVRSGLIDHYPNPVEPVTVTLDPRLCKRILGIDLKPETISGYLSGLGMTVTQSGDALQVVVPTRRPDITRPIDLVEEIVRLHGFDNLEPTMSRISMGRLHEPRIEPGHAPTIVPRSSFQSLQRLRTVLLAEGYYEAVNYSFMSQDDIDRLKLHDSDPRRFAHKVSNPLTSDQGLMRTTLVPGLLGTLSTNVAHRLFDVAMFEFGRVYMGDTEREILGLLATGRRVSHFTTNEVWSFFDVKGLVESLSFPFDVSSAEWRVPPTTEPYLHPGVQAEWVLGGTRLALVGQVHPALTQDLELSAPAFVAEIELDALFQKGDRETRHGVMGRYPAVTRDFALLMDTDSPFGTLEKAIDEFANQSSKFGAILETVELFDVYTGSQVPEGKRSLALKVVYRADDRTLTDEEIVEADGGLLSWLEKSVGAGLR